MKISKAIVASSNLNRWMITYVCRVVIDAFTNCYNVRYNNREQTLINTIIIVNEWDDERQYIEQHTTSRWESSINRGDRLSKCFFETFEHDVKSRPIVPINTIKRYVRAKHQLVREQNNQNEENSTHDSVALAEIEQKQNESERDWAAIEQSSQLTMCIDPFAVSTSPFIRWL